MTAPLIERPGWAAVVLAAGKGTRMRSRLPKVLHPLAGRPMILHVLDALRAAGFVRPVVVIGHGAEAVQAAIAGAADTVLQAEQLGTGHAVLQTLGPLSGGEYRHVLVVNGDVPLVRPETLAGLADRHIAAGATLTLATSLAEDPTGLGRITRDPAGAVSGIIEQADLAEGDGNLREVNVGLYAFALPWLWDKLQALPRSRSGEYYLTDILAAAVREGRPVSSVHLPDFAEAQGINDRVQLAQAEAVMRQRVRERLMRAGVTIIDPPSTFIDAEVEIGEDTVLLPNTMLQGHTVVGRDCTIGPGALVRDTTIGDRCTIGPSTLEESVVDEGTEIGPYCHLRPGARVGPHVHLGNYVEIKASRVGARTQIGHFSYIGDAEVGEGVNIGAGTITCNYDGVSKHRTTIGDGAFIGSDSMLVAPVVIGVEAVTGAGSVVTKDVPDGGLVMGVPARPVERPPRPLD